MEQPTCTHHWLIDSQLIGRCKKCSATKDFAKLQQKLPGQFKLSLRGTK